MTAIASTPRLYDFFNSSAAYRVRIALNLKGVAWEQVPINLRTGENSGPAYTAVNPIGLVPTYEHGATRIIESLAIIDYLDRHHPIPLMMPAGEPDRLRVLEIATIVSCDIHPINNMRILKYLTDTLELDEVRKTAWMHHWTGLGFAAVEAMLPDHDGWCVGIAPTLADCCLIPQVANATRAGFDLADFPRIGRIAAFCMRQPAFAAAAPTAQPDYKDH